MKPPTTLHLVWDHDLVFAGRSDDSTLTLDSTSQAGPSPVQTLAFALAGCMAMDLVYILQRGRYDLRGLSVQLSAERAPENPHRFVSVDMRFTVTGAVPRAQVERAIELSKEKYCSVWHSMRQDISLTTSISMATVP